MGNKADKISGASKQPTSTPSGSGPVQARPSPKAPPTVVSAEVDKDGNVTTIYSDGSTEGAQGSGK